MRPPLPCSPHRPEILSGRRAFTLIELLACLAIIGILAAILFSVFGSITKAKNNTVCLGNLRQIGNATLLYCNDHSGAFPPALSFPPAVTNAFSPWNQTIAPYLGMPNDTASSPIFKCPADPRDYEASPGHYARSYTFSATTSFTAGNSNDWMGLIQVSSPYATRKMNQVTVPGKTIMVTEWWTSTTGAIRDNWQDSYNYSTTNGWQSLANFPINADGKPNNYYHGASYNIAFVDGHVGSLTPAEICAGYDPGRNTYWRAVR